MVDKSQNSENVHQEICVHLCLSVANQNFKTLSKRQCGAPSLVEGV